jgi:hypothetical protein
MAATHPAPAGVYRLEDNPRSRARYRATGEHRPPLPGEHYLAGVPVWAHQAPHDVHRVIRMPQWIAERVRPDGRPLRITRIQRKGTTRSNAGQ